MAAGMLEPEIGLNGWELLFYQHEWQSAGCRTCVEGNWASATCIQVQITEVCIIHEPQRFLSPASGSISKAGCLPKTMCSKTFTHEKAEAKATGPASGVLGLNSYFPCGSVILAKALTQAFVQIQ